MPEDYSKTMNLPKTDFPMRANLPQREPEIAKHWENLYEKRLEKAEGQTKYVLHDGPPYANGDIHMGHTLNKILKDIIIKNKAMSGHQAVYIPGWDTHGLPIELQAIKKLKINKEEVKDAEFRDICRDFALSYIDLQRTSFKRLGVIGDWDNPYMTLKPEYEGRQLKVFGDMVGRDLIYKGLKPVYWCPTCKTALAEAEIEYADHNVDTIYVKFPISEAANKELKDASFVIWTTTTWTLPGNVAIAVGAEFDYALVEMNGEKIVAAKELLAKMAEAAGIENYKTLLEFKGSELAGIKCKHPFLDRESLVINADFVTLESGTGCVHVAPGHGPEDFEVCKTNYPELAIPVPIDGNGVLNELAGPFAGHYYEKANKTIKAWLEENGYLFASKAVMHQYPHCWRCKSPITFRATEQWFASVDSYKEQTLEEIKRVEWTPAWGEDRISAMVADRADWCISRQRLWGVPIPVFYCEDCGEVLLDKDVIYHVGDVFSEKGSNAWFEDEPKELLPLGTKCKKCDSDKFRKETDTMDVWFDSGTSHAGVLEVNNLDVPADMYLEGNDQYRGWFQSSLLTSVAHSGKAPYKAVLTHGFVVDGQGRKMSKSLGNGIPPEDIIKQFGADILRLWVASSDYKDDVKISDDIIKQISEVYRKIRNTSRFLLGNLYDFNVERDGVKLEDLAEIDRWALMQFNQLLKRIESAYATYDYHVVAHAIHNFCVVDLSNFYLDIVKDRLYCEREDSTIRKSTQTAMFKILDGLVRILAPVLSFSAEEIWQELKNIDGNREESVHLAQFAKVDESYYSEELEQSWNAIHAIKDSVAKELELARNEKTIGNSLEAKLKLTLDKSDYELAKKYENDLKDILLVSEIELLQGESKIEISRTEGHKCPRCWMYHFCEDEVCERCDSVLEKIAE